MDIADHPVCPIDDGLQHLVPRILAKEPSYPMSNLTADIGSRSPTVVGFGYTRIPFSPHHGSSLDYQSMRNCILPI